MGLEVHGGEKLARRQPFCSSLSAHTHLGASGGAEGEMTIFACMCAMQKERDDQRRKAL